MPSSRSLVFSGCLRVIRKKNIPNSTFFQRVKPYASLLGSLVRSQLAIASSAGRDTT